MFLNLILSIIILWIFSWLFIKVDNFIDKAIEFVQRRMFKQKPKNKRIFRSTGDIFADLKNSWLRDKYLYVYRFFLYIAQFPESFYYDTKYFIQRGLWGWSYRDVWSIDWFLSEILPQMLKRLKKTKHGCPILPGFPAEKDGNIGDKNFKKMQKKWDSLLDMMIYTFETARQIKENHWYYQESNRYSTKLAKRYKKLYNDCRRKRPDWYDRNFGRVMTKEECKKYEEGWKYFQKHFFSLWD